MRSLIHLKIKPTSLHDYPTFLLMILKGVIKSHCLWKKTTALNFDDIYKVYCAFLIKLGTKASHDCLPNIFEEVQPHDTKHDTKMLRAL